MSVKKGNVNYAEEGQTSQSIPSGVKSSDGSGERSGKIVNGVGMGAKDGGSRDKVCGKGSYSHKKQGY